MNAIIEIIKYFMFFKIILIDVKNKIIPEESVIILLIISLVSAVQNNDLEKYYIGICAYAMPLIVLYILEDYVKKTLIGFGDIKLMMAIGGLLKYENAENVINFYMLLYILSGIIVFLFMFFKKWKKCEYIPFAPFIIASYIIFINFFV